MDRVTALRRVGLVVLGANVALVAAKGAVYLSTGSVAVGSEAVNSLSDSVYSLVVVAGLYLTTQPPDFEHPHGHERIEPFVALFVAVGVTTAGAAVLWRAVETALAGGTRSAGPIGAVVLAGSAALKYFLYQYCDRMADAHNSPALQAAAIDNRADILTAGAALAGVLGAALGYPVLDPVAGGVVAVGILYTGVDIARDNVGYLVGRAPSAELREEIVRRARSHPAVEGVHDVIAHHVGPEVDVSLHIEIEGARTVREAHAIETAIVRAIESIPEVDDAFVHVDPRELGEWKSDADGDQDDPAAPRVDPEIDPRSDGDG